MIKKTNPTTKPKKSTTLDRESDFKKSPWLEDYKDCFTFRMQPASQNFIDRLATDLVEWAKNDDDALRLQDFHISKGVTESTYGKWKHKYENLNIAHQTAMSYIASRREKGALKRIYDKEVVFRRQHAYDPQWETDRQREKQDKIDIAIAVKKAAMEMGESKPQIIVLSELEFKKQEGNE